MKIVFLSLITAYFALCGLVFTTTNAAAGTAVVIATILLLVCLAVKGRRSDHQGLFFSGVIGLAWLAFWLGFAWDVPSDRRSLAIGGNPPPSVRVQLWIHELYLPITKNVEQDGSIFEFRSLLDGSFKNYKHRMIPSPASFSRLLVSLSTLLVSGAVGLSVSCIHRREPKAI
jgi:hypothetical protein